MDVPPKPKWGFPFSDYEKNGGVAGAPPVKGRRWRRMRARHRIRRQNDERRVLETAYANESKAERRAELRRQLVRRRLAYRMAVEDVAAGWTPASASSTTAQATDAEAAATISTRNSEN
jgi:hypothetical protein